MATVNIAGEVLAATASSDDERDGNHNSSPYKYASKKIHHAHLHVGEDNRSEDRHNEPSKQKTATITEETTTKSFEKDIEANAVSASNPTKERDSTNVTQRTSSLKFHVPPQESERTKKERIARHKNSSRRVSVYAHVSYIPGVEVRLFSPPRQRQKWGSDQVLPHVNWGDLFFDLFYVAAFYNLGNILVKDPSPIGIFYFSSCILSILMVWNSKLRYDSQFTYGDDIYHKAFEAVVLVVLAANVSFIHTVPRLSNSSKYPDMFAFSLSLTVLTLLNCARYVECFLYGRGQRKNIKHTTWNYLLFQIIPLAFYVAATVLSGLEYFGNAYKDDHRRDLAEAYGEDNENGEDSSKAYREDSSSGCYNSIEMHLPMLLVLGAYVAHQISFIIRIVCLMPKNGKHKTTTIPMNIDFVIHRLGELTNLVLGESVLSLLIVDGETASYYKTFFFGILTVIMLQMLHFRSQPHDPDAHAMRRSVNAGVLFTQTYPIYSAALIAVGASYKALLYSMKSYGRRLHESLPSEDEFGYRWLAGGDGDYVCSPSKYEKKAMVAHLFSVAMATVFICLDVKLVAHVGVKNIVERYRLNNRAAGKMRYNVMRFIFVLVPRLVVTIFIGAFGFWFQEPSTLALAGFVACICMLINRFLGNMLSPENSVQSMYNRDHGNDNSQHESQRSSHHGSHHDGHAEGVSDDDDDYWMTDKLIEDSFSMKFTEADMHVDLNTRSSRIMP